MKAYFRIILLFSLILQIIGCNAETATSEIEATSIDANTTPQTSLPESIEPTTTSTLRPTPTKPPISTELPIDTTSAPTPLPPMSLLDDFLFNEMPPNSCTLPCWQGLEIGKATESDVQSWFERNLGNSPSSEPSDRFSGKFIVVDHAWEIETDHPFGDGTFQMRFWVDHQTQLLEGIFFSWSPTVPNVVSPQRVIRELGTPSYWYLRVEGIPNATIDSVMLYDNGFGFWHFGETTVAPVMDQTGKMVSAPTEFCLDRTDFWGSAIIGKALESESLVELIYRDHPHTTVEAISDQSLTDIAQNAITQQHPCLSIDILGN